MFNSAFAFNKDVTGWNVCNVGDFTDMFVGSGQATTTLVPDANGQCIACPANYNSGSGEYIQGGNPCKYLSCLDNGSFRTALDLWFSDPTSATNTYGIIEDW